MHQSHGQGAGRSNSSKSSSEKSRKDWAHQGGIAPCARGQPKARHRQLLKAWAAVSHGDLQPFLVLTEGKVQTHFLLSCLSTTGPCKAQPA